MIERLTEDQEFLMAEVRDKWIDLALHAGDDLDQDAARAGIEWMYEITGLKKPTVIFVDSPLAVQYAANVLLIEKDSQVYSQVRSQVRSQVDSQVRSQVYSQVRSQVDSQVYSQVDSQVRSQVDSQVRSQVYSQVRSQVDSQVYSQVRSQKMRLFPVSYESLGWASGWASYCDFFAQIGVVDHAGLKKYLDYLKSGVFYGIFLDDFAIVCRRPKAVRRDDQTRLHSDQEPAIEWRDGYKLHYIHGQYFDQELWERIIGQKMTVKDVMGIGNADQRTMAWSMLRPDRLLKGMKAKLIHTGQKGTRLYEVKDFSKVVADREVDGDDIEYCMVMDDASTDRQFLEWVQPEIGKQGNADLCQATAWGIPLEDYLLIEQEA